MPISTRLMMPLVGPQAGMLGFGGAAREAAKPGHFKMLSYKPGMIRIQPRVLTGMFAIDPDSWERSRGKGPRPSGSEESRRDESRPASTPRRPEPKLPNEPGYDQSTWTPGGRGSLEDYGIYGG